MVNEYKVTTRVQSLDRFDGKSADINLRTKQQNTKIPLPFLKKTKEASNRLGIPFVKRNDYLSKYLHKHGLYLNQTGQDYTGEPYEWVRIHNWILVYVMYNLVI